MPTLNQGGRFSLSNNIQIPVYQEYLNKFTSYEDAIIINQLVFADRELTVYDIKHLSLYDKSIKTLRCKLNNLIDNGIVTKRKNTLYGIYKYSIRKDIFANSSKIVSLIESKDIKYGDYYVASLINFFRQKVINNNNTVVISMNEILEKLQFDKSRNTVKNKLRTLEKNNLIKPKLNGRIFEYELNSELILNNFSPELIDHNAQELTKILTAHLNSINADAPESTKQTFSRMLIDGCDFISTKHIIAYLASANNRYSSIIKTASHIKNHYDDLAYEAYKNLSKHKATKIIFKLLHGLKNPIKKQSKVVINNNIEDSKLNILGEKIEKWMSHYSNKIYGFCNQKTFLVGDMDVEDVMQEMKMILLRKMRKNVISVCPFMIGSKTIQSIFGEVQRVLHTHRNDKISDGFDIESVANHLAEENEEIDRKIIRAVSSKFSHIPEKAMKIIIDMLGYNGKLLTQKEAAAKYGYHESTFNRYIKPYFDELTMLTGISLKSPPIKV